MTFRPATLPLAVLLCSSLLGAAASAQDSRVKRAGSLDLPALPEPGASIIPSVPGDADLGKQVVLATPATQAEPFSLSLAASFFYTDNAALHPDVREDDWIFSPQARVSWTPELATGLYGETTVRYQMYRFDRDPRLDFESLNAGAGLIKSLPFLGGVNAFARYNYERLGDGGKDLYTSHELQTGLFHTWNVTDTQAVFAGLSGAFSMNADPGGLRHHTYGLLSGWRWTPCEWFSLETYYRFEYEDYLNNSREDISHTLGAAASLPITGWLTFSPLVSWTHNNSSDRRFDHEVLNAGAYLMAHFEF